MHNSVLNRRHVVVKNMQNQKYTTFDMPIAYAYEYSY